MIPKKLAWRASVISAVVVALLASYEYFFEFGKRAPQNNSTAPLSPALRLTNSLANDTHPRVSPDGTKIVFFSDRSGQTELYVINIAFASNRGSENGNYNIWVMDADGANPRMVTPPGGHNTEPSWTPDGRCLVFQSTRDFNPEIYIIEVAASSPAKRR